MKLGMNMLLWGPDVTAPTFQSTFELLKEIGYEGVEIPILDREVDKYAELGGRLHDLGLERVAVAARMADDNPIAADATVRREAVLASKANIDAAAALGASLMCGPLAAPLGVLSGAPPTAQERAWAVEHVREIAPYAQERGITIALEYVARFEMYLTNTAADLAELVREIDHPSCRMMYDTHQAHIEEKDPRAAIQACKDVLVHVHLSESDRSTPGTGQVQWEKTFAALHEIGYDGWAMVEAFGSSDPEFASATKIWRRMFESEEQLARDGAAFVRAGLGF